MGMINYDGSVGIWAVDYDVLSIVKVRGSWKCGKCYKPIPTGNQCWGRGYTKFCISCGIEVTENFRKRIKEIDLFLKSAVPKKDKLDKININNMVGNL